MKRISYSKKSVLHHRTCSKLLLLFTVAAMVSCGSGGYFVSSSSGIYLPVTQTSSPDPEVVALVNKYKTELDGQMNEVIGTSAVFMPYSKPESLLTNLTSDVMQQLGPEYTGGKTVDVAFMNVSGHRAPVAKGDITVGNLFSTYSFENELAVLQIKGEYLNEVFDAYARMGGAGVSSTVKLLVEDKKVKKVSVHGEPVDPQRIYTVVTLDYLAEGNSGMNALTKAESVVFPGITLRDYMIDYVRRQTAAGKEIVSELDGRIIVEQ